MKTITSIVILISFLFVGCATRVASIYNTDVALKKPATYRVYSENEYASTNVENKNLDSLLLNIISERMAFQGLKTSALPDVIVSYKVSVYTSSDTRKNGYGTYDRYNNYNAYNYSTSNYKEGILIIDIKNDDGKLIWQGSKTFKIRSRQSVRALLPEDCREIMTYFNLVTSQ